MKIILFLFVLFDIVFAQIMLDQNQKEYLTQKQTIKMCVDPDWEPFEKIDKDGKHVGIAADLIELISKKLNMQIELVPTKTWEESIEFSKQHKCDILSFLNKTPKREEWLVFTEPIFRDPNVIVGRSEKKYIDDLSTQQLSIALPKETAMAERFEKDFPNLTIIPTVTEDEAFDLVETRKADITLRSMIVTAYTIKKNGIFNLKIIGQPEGYENIFRIGVRKDEPILRDILNQSITTITEKDLDRIVNNHVSIKIERVTTLTIALWIFVVLVLIIFVILLWNYILNKKVKIEIEKNAKQQEALLEQKKKAEIGELIANISHQWKNGLTQISSLNLEMILMQKFSDNPNEELLTRLNETENSIKFMSETINTFLGYYKGEIVNSSFLICQNIEDVLTLIDIDIKNSQTKINIVQNYKFEIFANKNECYHIWLNLISNSIKAAKQKQIYPVIDICINKNEVIYEDNCGGIEEKILEDIKNENNTGLGLKMITTILHKTNSKLYISNTEKGTKFRIYFDS